jgi:hypothetical protein
MHLHFTGNFGLAELVAALALLVSALAFLRPWWRERRSALDARLESYWAWRFDKPARDHRVVLLNRGPGAARDVSITIRNEDGEPFDLLIVPGRPRDGTLAVPVVHAQQEMHWMYFTEMGGSLPTTADIAWRDGRLRKQSATIWLTTHEVL